MSRSFPDSELANFLGQHPKARALVRVALASLEDRLSELDMPFVVLSELQADVDEADGGEERLRFVVRVKVPGLAVDRRMDLWDELSRLIRKEKARAITSVPPPRAEPFEVGKNLVVHMDLT